MGWEVQDRRIDQDLAIQLRIVEAQEPVAEVVAGEVLPRLFGLAIHVKLVDARLDNGEGSQPLLKLTIGNGVLAWVPERCQEGIGERLAHIGGDAQAGDQAHVLGLPSLDLAVAIRAEQEAGIAIVQRGVGRQVLSTDGWFGQPGPGERRRHAAHDEQHRQQGERLADRQVGAGPGAAGDLTPPTPLRGANIGFADIISCEERRA